MRYIPFKYFCYTGVQNYVLKCAWSVLISRIVVLMREIIETHNPRAVLEGKLHIKLIELVSRYPFCSVVFTPPSYLPLTKLWLMMDFITYLVLIS
jgi:hypothetical protein